MFRAPLRRLQPGLAGNALARRSVAATRRGLATGEAPKPKKGTWKGTALRWGAAIGAVYWYNTSPLFADDPLPQTGVAPPSVDDHDLVTVDKVIAEKRKVIEARAREREALEQAQKPTELEWTDAPPAETPTEATPAPVPVKNPPSAGEKETEGEEKKKEEGGEAPVPGSPEALEEEAGQQGAFNPETGEINWDCPCLGGMADGPCGEEFKAAFSCFVYSKEEPKGMDCIDKFQGMQDCFRKYPDIYGAELTDDEDPDAPAPAPAPADAQPPASDAPASPTTETKEELKTEEARPAGGVKRSPSTQNAPAPGTAVPSADDAVGKPETQEAVKPTEFKTPEGKN